MTLRLITLFAFVATSGIATAQTDIEEWMQNQRPEHIESFITDDHGTRRAKLLVGSQKTAPMKAYGEQNIPIVLVQFPDRPFAASGSTVEEVRASFELFFNGTNTEEIRQKIGSYGSVRQYFETMSRGQFTPHFTLIGPITTKEGYAFYGKNSGTSKDVSIGSMYKEAVLSAVNNFEVDWSTFDNDKNGKVDIVYFIHAGWGENSVSKYDANAIWAKEGVSELSVTPEEGDKVVFSSYGVSSEARYVDKSKLDKDASSEAFGPTGYNPNNLRMDGIGVCVHEVSHALGLPDFYDIYYEAFGMDVWSIMDYGEYANNSYTPAAYNAYERSFMGWEELVDLTEPQKVTLQPFARGGVGCRVTNPENTNEYYVLENRQPEGWDVSVCGVGRHGMMVTHVDYDATQWSKNMVNTDVKHQRMTLIPANNKLIGTNNALTADEWTESLAGNLYPGNTFNYDLTDETTPAAVVYHGESKLMGQPIRNIEEHEDGSITFFFRTNGQLATPEPMDVAKEERDETSFMARWEQVEDATRYVVEITKEGEMPVTKTVTENNCLFDALEPGCSYKFRVQAIHGNAEEMLDSEWSEFKYVDTHTYISRLPEDDQLVTIYSMDATPISRCRASQLNRIDIHPGIYVLKYQDGQIKKVVLR
ncbi:MAG: M6 family metalloprotease domain-containing protein [Bacteroidales bacterium]|nr:M6 family metalloprotease domain-containing protein [Candidatus Physcousia equi]